MKNEKQCSIHITNKRFLSFDNIYDLLQKVKNIEKAHKIQSNLLKQVLQTRGIKFRPISDYDVEIDISLITEEDMQFIKNQDTSFIQKVYNENGVTLNV